VSIEVFVADEQNDQPVDTMRWVRLAESVLLDEGVPGDAELSMLFIDEAAMADLNKRFLGKDGPTDVLAFPIDEEPVEGGRSPDSGGTGPGDTSEPTDMPTVLGDVVICPAVAHRNAPEHAGTYDDEVALLVVHGLLHLLGMDHEEDDEAETMEEREQALLTKFHRAPPAADASTSAAGTAGKAEPPAGAQPGDSPVAGNGADNAAGEGAGGGAGDRAANGSGDGATPYPPPPS
jgi:probable rRNA maturation factor